MNLIDKLENLNKFIQEKIVIDKCNYSTKDKELIFLSLLLQKPNSWKQKELKRVKELLNLLNPFIQIEEKKVIFTMMLKAQLDVQTPKELFNSYVNNIDELYCTDEDFIDEYFSLWSEINDLVDDEWEDIELISYLLENLEDEFNEDGDLNLNQLMYYNLSVSEKIDNLRKIDIKITNNQILQTNMQEVYEFLTSEDDEEYNECIQTLDYRNEEDEEDEEEFNELKNKIIEKLQDKLPKDFLDEINN